MRPLLVTVLVLVVGCGRPPPRRPAQAGPPGEPAPASKRESYAAEMAALDVGLIATAGPVINLTYDHIAPEAATLLGILYVAGYVAGGPLLHQAFGNHEQALPSVGRRLGYPLLGGLVGAGMVGLLHEENSCEGPCGIVYLVGAVIGAGVGAIIGVIRDWTSAHVDY